MAYWPIARKQAAGQRLAQAQAQAQQQAQAQERVAQPDKVDQDKVDALAISEEKAKQE